MCGMNPSQKWEITMSHLITRFWKDDAGFIISAELVLIATILVLGLIVGLTAIRKDITSELTEVGQAFGGLDQGYSYMGISNCHSFSLPSGVFDTYQSNQSTVFAGTSTNISVNLCGPTTTPPLATPL